MTAGPRERLIESAITLIREHGVHGTGLTEDLYLSLLPGTDFAREVVVLRIIIQPLVLWLWVGGTLMFAGTFLAAFPGRRRRDPLDPVSAPVAEGRTAIDRSLDADRSDEAVAGAAP